MNNAVKRRIQEFVEQEEQSPVDSDLLEKLQGILEEDTLYWSLTPEKRNALNKFFEMLHSDFISAIVGDKYGAHIVIDSMIVTAFEVGFRVGRRINLHPQK